MCFVWWEEERPHLVLLDLMLPGNDGIELMKDIVEMADVPVIFLSAYGQGPARRQGFRYGGRRLSGQALLAGGTRGQDRGCPAPAGDARAVSAIRPGRPDHKL